MVQVGFIGCGKMGSALIGALIEHDVCSSTDVICFDKNSDVLNDCKIKYGIQTASSCVDVVKKTDIIFLCVKPVDADGVIREIVPEWSVERVLVSICAGKKISFFEGLFQPSAAKIVRVMPNMPCLVGHMAAGYAVNKELNEDDIKMVNKMLSSAGIAYRLSEEQLDAVTGLSGSGPAYVAHFIEEFAKAGVKMGLPEDVSYGLSLETFIGTAQLMRQKNLNPQELKTIITSPNGTTLAGRNVLESSNISDIILQTIQAGTSRSIELGLSQSHH